VDALLDCLAKYGLELSVLRAQVYDPPRITPDVFDVLLRHVRQVLNGAVRRGATIADAEKYAAELFVALAPFLAPPVRVGAEDIAWLENFDSYAAGSEHAQRIIRALTAPQGRGEVSENG
jgi:hypothetical protein